MCPGRVEKRRAVCPASSSRKHTLLRLSPEDSCPTGAFLAGEREREKRRRDDYLEARGTSLHTTKRPFEVERERQVFGSGPPPPTLRRAASGRCRSCRSRSTRGSSRRRSNATPPRSSSVGSAARAPAGDECARGWRRGRPWHTGDTERGCGSCASAISRGRSLRRAAPPDETQQPEAVVLYSRDAAWRRLTDVETGEGVVAPPPLPHLLAHHLV